MGHYLEPNLLHFHLVYLDLKLRNVEAHYMNHLDELADDLYTIRDDLKLSMKNNICQKYAEKYAKLKGQILFKPDFKI